MKKILLTMVAVLFTAAAFAGSSIKVQQGDKKFLKTAQGTATIEILWNGAVYDKDKKKAITTKFSDISSMCKKAESDFAEKFNDKSKGLKFTTDGNSANYKFTFQLTMVDQFMNVMSFVPGLSTNIWGTLTITDAKTGETVVVVSVDDLNGGNNPSTDQSFADSFQELAEQLLKKLK